MSVTGTALQTGNRVCVQILRPTASHGAAFGFSDARASNRLRGDRRVLAWLIEKPKT